MGFVEINELKRAGVEHVISYSWLSQYGIRRELHGEKKFDDEDAAKAYYLVRLNMTDTVSVSWKTRVIFATPWKDVFKSVNS